MALDDVIFAGESYHLEEIPTGTLGTPDDMIAETVAVEELVSAGGVRRRLRII